MAATDLDPIDISGNLMRNARTAAQRAMDGGMDHLDAAYYVAAAANSPIRQPVLPDGSLDVDACNYIFAALVEEFRPAALEV